MTALVAVALGVGLIAGIAMFVGANVVGFGGGGSGESTDRATDPDAGATLYAPAPVPTKTATGPAITLHASPTTATEKKAASSSASPSEKASKSTTADNAADKTSDEKSTGEKRITLQAGTVSAKPMETISLTGIYPGGEGAILRLERREGGTWKEFGISDVRVTGEQFTTKIQSGRIGRHKFRMKDVDSGAVSNKVSVTIG
ncbi:hypothetical protein [Nocardioides albertanoniae]|uniref:hypothetical protein n=1 Tax=Nocardioides albertanoniae TaxID=1175486 RepID=UPI00114F7609|nr:hypothetical protein [Nocardioides albertanoniae]